MKNSAHISLGRYLVDRDAITERQLEEGIRLQKQSNALIGAIAVARGVLDADQLRYLVERRSRVDEPIGKLAVGEGFMSQEDLRAILDVQAGNHLYLGESLVRLGAINREALDKALDDLELRIVRQNRKVRDQFGHLPLAEEARVTLEVTLRFLYRLGYAARICGAGDGPPQRGEQLYCAEQIFRRRGTGRMGLRLDGALAGSLVRETGLAGVEAMSQLVFNLNYLVCRHMRRGGMRVRHGDACIEAPAANDGAGVCLAMETPAGSMFFTYGVRGMLPRSGPARMAM